MTLPTAPRLRACIAGYYVALFLFGAIGSLLAPGYEGGILGFFAGGLWIVFLVHAFFVAAPSIQGDLLAYAVFIGVLMTLVFAAMKLTGWLRNFVFLAALLAGHAYGLAVAGMNG